MRCPEIFHLQYSTLKDTSRMLRSRKEAKTRNKEKTKHEASGGSTAVTLSDSHCSILGGLGVRASQLHHDGS